MEIIFIDDELQRIEVYIEDLEIAFEQMGDKTSTILPFGDLESAYKYIQEWHERIDLVVLDVMMPGGNTFYDKEIDPMGMKSGFFLCKKINELYPELSVMMFTNVTDPDIEQYVEDRDKTKLKLSYKDEMLPFELTRLVTNEYRKVTKTISTVNSQE